LSELVKECVSERMFELYFEFISAMDMPAYCKDHVNKWNSMRDNGTHV